MSRASGARIDVPNIDTGAVTRERPILFSGSMVRAILEGRKTQTRRVLRHQPEPWMFWDSDERQFEGPLPGTDRKVHRCMEVVCPYGQPGDLLWVRETWGLWDTSPEEGPARAHLFYRATDGDRHELRHQLWRPSIHMPRWASRLSLQITQVRVERLQSISEDDARSEGIEFQDDAKDAWRGWKSFDGTCLFESARASFEQGWDSINGDRAPWNSNPWVWVVTFARADRSAGGVS